MHTRTKGMVPVYRCDGCRQSAHPYGDAVCALNACEGYEYVHTQYQMV